MTDPLAEIVSLLQPTAPYSKMIEAAGRWRVRRTEYGRPFYCVVLSGSCWLEARDHAPIMLEAGDFVLIPSVHEFAMMSADPPPAHQPYSQPVRLGEAHVRLGAQSGRADVRLLLGYCVLASPDAGLLLSLLPRRVHLRADDRLASLVWLVGDEARKTRPARDVILSHLLEVMFIEALRSTTVQTESPSFLRGLADERLAAAIRRIHEDPARSWTIAELAKEAALSRSIFFDRFNRAVGISPMGYLLSWRMALAKKMLRENDGTIAEIARRVGYGSASAFSVAFTRHVGLPPSQFSEQEVPA